MIGMSDKAAAILPRVGFLGVGWIGLSRMQALVDGGHIVPSAVVDPSDEAANAAIRLAPDAKRYASFEEMLAQKLDGIVIATPTAAHAQQAIAALRAGSAVFCQKPLACDSASTRRVIEEAQAADRLLGVDMSYRHLQGMQAIRTLIAAGSIGQVYCVDLIFHNAYGPDKEWFYRPELSGGGCVIDLGVHLVDLAMWSLGATKVSAMASRLFAKGRRIMNIVEQVEDHAIAQFELDDRITINLACSWRLSAGTDAIIDAFFHGTRGGLELHNVNGSFYEFRAERYSGTQREILSNPPEQWQGSAVNEWAKRLAACRRFDQSALEVLHVAEALDLIYGRRISGS